MENTISTRFKRAWNAFFNKDPTRDFKSYWNTGPSSYYRPDRVRLSLGTEKSIVSALYNRIATDVAAIDIMHVRLDDDGRFKETIKSGLNECLTVEANIDQTGRQVIFDTVMSMFDEGCCALVPVETDKDPDKGSFDILSMRTGRIVEWRPKHIKVKLYNENSGKTEDIMLEKQMTAIMENPFYAVMNEHNSVGQRLIRKLNLLDVIDEQSSSGKFNLIVQLPYSTRSETQKLRAEERRQRIEEQLTDSKYGIAYIDSAEHVTQLNRPIENNLMSQIEYLTNMLYSQFGVTQEILNGTADEQTMLNYYNQTIEPVISTLTNEMRRKFLTKTARTQGQSIKFFRDPFRLVPVSQIAEIADKFTRNEIASSNEIRSIIGWKPSNDPSADELRNKNLNQAAGEKQNGVNDDAFLDKMLTGLEGSVD